MYKRYIAYRLQHVTLYNILCRVTTSLQVALYLYVCCTCMCTCMSICTCQCICMCMCLRTCHRCALPRCLCRPRACKSGSPSPAIGFAFGVDLAVFRHCTRHRIRYPRPRQDNDCFAYIIYACTLSSASQLPEVLRNAARDKAYYAVLWIGLNNAYYADSEHTML